MSASCKAAWVGAPTSTGSPISLSGVCVPEDPGAEVKMLLGVDDPDVLGVLPGVGGRVNSPDGNATGLGRFTWPSTPSPFFGSSTSGESGFVETSPGPVGPPWPPMPGRAEGGGFTGLLA